MSDEVDSSSESRESKFDWVRKTLDMLGLWKPIQKHPALPAVITIVAITIEYGVVNTSLFSGGFVVHLASVVIAVILGSIVYFSGAFWDSVAYDRRYSWYAKKQEPDQPIRGKWLDRPTRPWHVFPAGRPLLQSRAACALALRGSESETYGLYDEAKEVVRNAGAWTRVALPIVLSKFIRSWIWPLLLGSLSSAGLAVAEIVWDWPGVASASSWIIAAIALGLSWFLSFIPFFELRVQHNRALYRTAAKHAA